MDEDSPRRNPFAQNVSTIWDANIRTPMNSQKVQNFSMDFLKRVLIRSYQAYNNLLEQRGQPKISKFAIVLNSEVVNKAFFNR